VTARRSSRRGIAGRSFDVIEIRDLYKYYGDRRAIGPLTAKIEDGEIVGLLGLNGAGKTTTLRILACDLLPTSGSVRVNGIDVVERPDEVRRRIGYLPDTPPIYEEMRVGEFLTFAARLRGVPKSDVERRVTEVIDLTEVSAYADDVIAQLSHGFRQRVGIAQAIVHKPALVVLDEPISGLDPVQIVEMRALVRSLGGAHTVVVSSHILSEISETCDRILVIRDGQIVEAGTEADLSTRMLQGMRLELTARSSDTPEAAASRLQSLLLSIPGITEVEPHAPSEPGDGVVTVLVQTTRDVRDEICRAMIGADWALLGLGRSGRELESVFLQLTAEGDGERGSRGRRATGPRRGTTGQGSAS
jgi:ABC-2 type transport system ATP-binding protein